MLFIPNAQVERAAHLIDTSQLADNLAETAARAKQGRKANLSLRTFLIGAYIAIEELGSFKVSSIYEVLTHMELSKQWELGVRFMDNGTARCIKIDSLYNLTRSLPARLAYTPEAARHWKQDIDQTEMQRRREGLDHALDRLLDASIVQPGGSWYALDGSGAWSWGRSKFKVKDDDDVREQEEVFDPEARTPDDVAATIDPDNETEDEDNDETDNETDKETDKERKARKSRKYTNNYDPDAAVGTKTHDFGGRAPFYGYVMDAAIRISGPNEPPQPVLIERLVVSPANADVVAPSLQMLDSLLDTTDGVTDIVVDRHYPFKKTHRWADQLRARQIAQHFDLRSDEQGFRDVNGMRLVAGWAHCPATPDSLADIPRPGPGATEAEKEEFERLIALRRTFAMERHERVNANGRCRWKCPALAGAVGCPRRPETMEVAKTSGLPIIQNPPGPEEEIPCCTNKSGIASDRSERTRKHEQPHYWGSPEWKDVYNRRTYVEGLFGSLKNPDTEGVRRGFMKFVGLPMVSLGLTLAAAACNVRHQRKFWADDPARPDHPLLAEDPEFHGVRSLTAEEAEASTPTQEQHADEAA